MPVHMAAMVRRVPCTQSKHRTDFKRVRACAPAGPRSRCKTQPQPRPLQAITTMSGRRQARSESTRSRTLTPTKCRVVCWSRFRPVLVGAGVQASEPISRAPDGAVAQNPRKLEPNPVSWAKSLILMVAKGGIEPPTRGFSIPNFRHSASLIIVDIHYTNQQLNRFLLLTSAASSLINIRQNWL